MPGSILVVVSYVLLAVFVLAFLVRTVRMAKQPVHLRWELAPIPHEKGKSHYGGSYFEEYEWWTKPREKSLVTEVIYMLQEIVFLKGVWEHNRRLWWFSFPFHFGLYLLIAVAAIFILLAVVGLVGVPVSGLTALSTALLVLATAGYTLGGIGALGLFISRHFDPRLEAFTSPGSLLNLVIVLAVFSSGELAVVGTDYVASILGFVKGLLTADVSIEVPGILATHIVVVFLFMAYLPFSQMMHFVAKYFTYHEVRWNDQPMTPGSHMENEIRKLLSQPVTWSAPHLKTDGKKNWVDIATEEIKK